MLVPFVAFLLQSSAPAVVVPTAPAQALAAAVPGDSSGNRRGRAKRAPKRAMVTDAHRATAFRSPAAQALLLLARSARTRQDSALTGYDATTYQRTSAGLRITDFGRQRLAFRSEQATRVRWRRGVGAHVDVTGSRTVVPIAGRSARVNIDRNISPIPYFPGSETLWIGSSTVRQSVDENEGIVHPLAEGSEAYYVFETGDSASFRLPDNTSIRLRELTVRPRVPQWNLAVGSLWFDLAGGQLVRAAYRMSVPMDIATVAKADDSTNFDDVPFLVKPLLFPMTAQVSAIGVEYGLYQGRFWLPRVQVLKGGVNMGVARMPFELEQKFTYENVNGGASLPPIPASADTVGGSAELEDSDAGSNAAGRARRDSARVLRRARRKAACASAGEYTYARRSKSNPDVVFVTIPCDSTKLADSPTLPASIYDRDEEISAGADIDALVETALSMGAQAQFAPQLPIVALARPRYNRIEGLSVGGRVDQELGLGYSLHALGRIGIADREPAVELVGKRSDAQRTVSLTVYNRLVSASDWGNPLSLGSSLRAFLFGRDDGFYYRGTGVSIGSSSDLGAPAGFSWTIFGEQQRTARQQTTFSLARSARGAQFQPNIEATRGTYVGGQTRFNSTLGQDPLDLRLLSDVRLEAARGDTGGYARLALDLTASRGIGIGAAAITLAGGSTLGAVPVQRNWFLGGPQSVRGQAPGTAQGDAFWMARGEVAYGRGVILPVIFGDVGWAGSRRALNDGTSLAGVGLGATVLDGLIRVDLARGLYPSRGYRVDAYLEARF